MHSENTTSQNRYIFIKQNAVNWSVSKNLCSKDNQDPYSSATKNVNSFHPAERNISTYNTVETPDAVNNAVNSLRNVTKILINPRVASSFLKQNTEVVSSNCDEIKASNMFINPHHEKMTTPKVLVNPHFKKTVYVNPNFNQKCATKLNIHVNPNIIHGSFDNNTIAVNRRVLQLHNDKQVELPTLDYSEKASVKSQIDTKAFVPLQSNMNEVKTNMYSPKTKLPTAVSTGNKFITLTERSITSPVQKTLKKRRSSLKTKYKIIKSDVLNATPVTSVITANNAGRSLYLSKYKILRNPTLQVDHRKVNHYKIDNRSPSAKFVKECCQKSNKRKYVYIDKFFSMKYIANSVLIKQSSRLKTPGYINVNGILYKKSPNSMRKAVAVATNKKDVLNKHLCKSKYKIVKKGLSTENSGTSKSSSPKLSRNIKLIRTKLKRVVSNKMRKSNVPCSIYRKYGKCSGKDNGKCIKIHNPNQVVLCTKFLQGACLKTNCLLSHKVSAEKMPTCKYFLEGTCSREDCQYLHVKISPKADICKDFLEGFCEKAAECDRRHQFLCPDYEKYGTCPRKRCSYPHGSMVRNFHARQKLAKKCSVKPTREVQEGKHEQNDNTIIPESVNVDAEMADKILNVRYYETPDKLVVNSTDSNQDEKNNEKSCDYEVFVKNRPKLGSLPSYIPLFEDGS